MQSRLFMVMMFFFVSLLSAQEVKQVAFYTKNIAKVSNKDVQIAIKKILDIGSKQSGVELNEKFPDRVEDVVEGFVSGKYSLITLNTSDVIQNYNRISSYIGKIWTITKRKNFSKIRYFLLVKRKKAMQKADLLVDGDLALVDFDNMQRLFIDSYLLSKYHKSSEIFFHKVKKYPSSSSVILKLFFSKVDACIVSEHAYNLAVELNPQLKKRLMIVAKSEQIFPSIALTISRKGDDEITKLYDDFSNEKEEVQTFANVLLLYKAEAVVYFSQKEMDRLLLFYKDYLALKKRYE